MTNYSEFKRSDLPKGYDLRNFWYGGGLFMQLRVNHLFPAELLYVHVSTVIASPLDLTNPTYLEIDLDFNSIRYHWSLAIVLVLGAQPFASGVGSSSSPPKEGH